MAHKRKHQLVKTNGWNRHLRKEGKRVFHGRTRAAEKREFQKDSMSSF